MRNITRSRDKTTVSYNEGLRKYMMSVFAHMGLGLLLTAFVSYVVAASPEFFNVIWGTPLRWLIIFAPLGVVIYVTSRFAEMSYETARAFFFIYAFLIGVSFSSIFMIYNMASIAQTFLVTSATFGAMSLYGYTTRSDLTGMGSFLMMALVGVILSMLANFFLRSSALDMAVSLVCVFVFTALTAYDIQNIKALYSRTQGEEIRKTALFGAFQLYIDFINIFIHLLRFMGSQKR